MDAKFPLLPPLTSLRFFAALGVVIFHTAGRWGLPSHEWMPFNIGVELFFLLSGFVLAYNYRSVPSVGDGLRIIGYRIARIWPLHILMLLLFVLSYDIPATLHLILLNAFMLQAWVGNDMIALSGNPLAWTISVEFAFYLLFPLLIALSTRNLVALTLALTLALIVWAMQVRGVPATPNAPFATAIMRMHPGSFLIQFVAGILLCRVYLARDWKLRSATSIEIVAVVLAIIYAFGNTLAFHALSAIWVGPPFLRFFAAHILSILAFAPLIFVLAAGNGTISRVLCNRTLVFLGEVSFATYLCHIFIIEIVLRAKLTDVASLIVCFGLIYCVSVGLYLGVERPAQRVLRRVVDISLALGGGAEQGNMADARLRRQSEQESI